MSEQKSPDQDGSGTVHLRVEGAVATVVFDRPAARNALTWSMYEQLGRACDAINGDPAVRVAVLRGAGGKAFIAGTDIAQFRAFESGADGIQYEKRLAGYAAKVDALRVPTVAVVDGPAVGGGMAIASLCDFRLATPGARFGVPVARTLGNCLSAANLELLVGSLGVAMVRRMLLLAELVPAEELVACGFVLKTVPAPQMDAALAGLCGQLAGLAPITLSVTRALLSRVLRGSGEPDTALIERCYASEDFHEGVEAFLHKRPPRWSGR